MREQIANPMITFSAVIVICVVTGNLFPAEVHPGQSIQQALNAAKEGEAVLIKPGLYTEHLKITKSRIKLIGEPGVVFDVRHTFPTGWMKATQFDPAERVWSIRLPFRPGEMYWKGKHVEGIHPATMSGEANGWADSTRQKCTGQELMCLEQNDFYWTGGEVVWGYRTADPQTVFVRFADREKFAPQDLSFVPEIPVIHIYGNVDEVTVSGIKILSGHIGILLENGPRGCIIENNYISGCRDSISLVRDGGSNIIRKNTCTLNHIKTLNPNHKDHVQVWRRFKSQGFKDGRGVVLTDFGHNNQVYENAIFEHWDGVQTVEDWGDETPGRGVKIYRNVMSNLADDALEPSASEIESEWFENIVHNAGLAIRIKNCSVGPAYFYRNKLHAAYDPPHRAPDGSSSWGGGKGIYFYTETPGNIYIYHNSFQGCGLSPSGSKNVGKYGFKNTWILNNVFSCEKFCKLKQMKWDPHFHHNWCGGDATQASWMGMNNIIATGIQIWHNEDKSFILPPGHLAINAGLDLSKPFKLDGVEHPPLPGMTPDYYKHGRVDMGAVQGGQAK